MQIHSASSGMEIHNCIINDSGSCISGKLGIFTVHNMRGISVFIFRHKRPSGEEEKFLKEEGAQNATTCFLFLTASMYYAVLENTNDRKSFGWQS